MAGIFPDVAFGGVVVRTQAGAAVPAVNVQNVYRPAAAFNMTCDETGVPSDCTGTITPAQINGIVSEMVALAEALTPAGTWNCSSLTNLASALTARLAAIGVTDGVTITGNGTVGNPYVVNTNGVAASICATLATSAALWACLSGNMGAAAAAAPNGGVNAAIPTDYFGTFGKYLADPVRWVSYTLPGVPGVITVPSYT